MREQYVWPAGTPVLMVGFRSESPGESEIESSWVTVSAGRLAEDFRPGTSVIMKDGPLAVHLPIKGWETNAIYRHGGRGWGVGKSDAEYAEYVHASWKRAFMFCAEKGTEAHLGARCFIMLRSEADFPDRAGIAQTSLVDRLETMEHPSFHELLPLVSEIVSNVRWQMGGYYGWATAAFDARGEIMRLCCVTHMKMRRLRLGDDADAGSERLGRYAPQLCGSDMKQGS